MGVVLKGAEALAKTLGILGGDVNLAGRNALRRGIQKIQVRAQEYAPREFGSLEDAIKVQESNPGRGQWLETVYVDMNHPAPERIRKSGPVVVGDYALYAHENIPGGIGKGKESIAKARSSGKRVGPRYMARAFRDLKDEVKRDVETAIQDAIARRDAKKASAPLRAAKDSAAPIRKPAKKKTTKAVASKRPVAKAKPAKKAPVSRKARTMTARNKVVRRPKKTTKKGR